MVTFPFNFVVMKGGGKANILVKIRLCSLPTLKCKQLFRPTGYHSGFETRSPTAVFLHIFSLISLQTGSQAPVTSL